MNRPYFIISIIVILSLIAAPAFAQVVSVKDFGASGDGSTNDRSAFKAAFNSGGRIIVPAGNYLINGDSLTIPANTELSGTGGATIVSNEARDAGNPIFLITDNNVIVSNLCLKMTAAVRSNGISIKGKCEDVLLDNIELSDLFIGVHIAGADKKAQATRITLRRCRYRHSASNKKTSQFGFMLDYCRDILIENCHASKAWLDGLKIRKHTNNVIVRGGDFSFNGICGAGDGIDAYTGANTLKVIGTTLNNNIGSGMLVKTGSYTKKWDSYIKNMEIIGITCQGNSSAGLTLNRSEKDDRTQTLVAGVSIAGGIFANNGRSGIYVRARNVSIQNVICRGNARYGINLSTYGRDIDVVGAQCLGNGPAKSEGGFGGIQVNASRVRIAGGTVNGKDSDNIGSEKEDDGTKAVSKYAVIVRKSARDVIVEDVNFSGCTAKYPLYSQMDKTSTGYCIFRYCGTGKPGVGGVGSQYTQIDYTTDPSNPQATLYFKESGLPKSTKGWVKK